MQQAKTIEDLFQNLSEKPKGPKLILLEDLATQGEFFHAFGLLEKI